MNALGVAAFALFSLCASSALAEAADPLRLVPEAPLPEKILVGDALVYRLEPPAAEALRFDPIESADPLSAGFRAILEGGKLRLHPVRSGALTFPALSWRDADGKEIGRSEAFGLQVESVLGTKEEPPPALLPALRISLPTWAVVVGLLLVALALAVLGWLLLRFLRRARNRGFTPFPSVSLPPKPEAEEALDALARLDGEGLPSRGEFRLHAYRLSEILKRYLGRRYGFDAPECTTEEIRSRIDGFPLGPEARRALLDLLARLDRVKFADEKPTPQGARDDLQGVRQIVEWTRKQPDKELHAVS